MEKEIFIFGASIAYGAYDLEFGGWVNRLKNSLDKQLKGVRIFTWQLTTWVFLVRPLMA